MRKKEPEGSKLINYSTELLISGLMMLGVFLLKTEIPFQVIILSAMHSMGKVLREAKQFLISIFYEPVLRLEGFDILGLFLIVYAFGLCIGQIRKRIISSSYETHDCPACGSKLHRIHRQPWQRSISRILFLGSGYYHCGTCGNSSLHFYNKTTHLKHS